MNYVFLENSIHGIKKSFPVNFWFISGEISVEKKILENCYSTKKFVFEFKGSLLSNFWANVPISAVMSILEDFGSLLPALSVAVKS